MMASRAAAIPLTMLIVSSANSNTHSNDRTPSSGIQIYLTIIFMTDSSKLETRGN